MLTQDQAEKLIQSIPSDVEGENRRAAYAVITGFKNQNNLTQIVAYYSISVESAEYWWNYFNFSSGKTAPKRGRKNKSSNLLNYVYSNVGKVVTPKVVADEVGVSLPTFYNFYNSNRTFFKKVKRGEFQIVDPKEYSNQA